MHSPFLNYADLTARLRELAELHPDRMELSSLGQSFESRQIWLVTLSLGPADRKPAVWVDGNIHGTELSASSACLKLVEHLLEQTELLQRRTFYVAPRLCPDGAELACAPRPRYLRSSTRPSPFEDSFAEGWEIEDVDGDGTVRTIRIPDPHGPWKACPDEPRLLTRRLPEDRQGPFYRTMREGRFVGDGWEAEIVPPSPRGRGLDLNRNFPYGWRPEGQQQGSGPYPTSEPEVRALVDFLTAHHNVCFAVTFHTMSGCLLRPSCDGSDDTLPTLDLDTYRFLGERGTQWSGYPEQSVFHDFRYDPKDNISGTFHDWAYQQLGHFAWTVELWSPFRAAGITEGFTSASPSGKRRFIRWFRQHSPEEERQLLQWSDRELGGAGYADWKPFQHPQLGEVEIGGWDVQNALRNPPARYLDQELEPLVRWVTWLAESAPELALGRSACVPLGGHLYRLELVVDNAGWLPTDVTQLARDRKLVRPLRVELTLDAEVELLEGEPRSEHGQLAGVCAKPSHVPYWWASDGTEHRCRVRWLVQGPPGARVFATARHDRAGTVQVEWTLGS